MENWAVIIAALITVVGGFGGIIVTLLFHHRAQKKEWANNLTRGESEQRSERNSLRSALLAELRFARDNVLGRAIKSYEEALKDSSGHSHVLLSLKIPPDSLYRSNSGRIGLLSKSEACTVVSAYARLDYRSEFLRIWYRASFKTSDDKMVTVPDGCVGVLANQVKKELEAEKGRVKSIDAAIHALEEAHEERG